GVLNLRSNTALGSTAAGTELTGGTLEIQGGIAVVGELLRVHPAIDAGPAEIVSSAGSNTWSGPIDLAIDAGPAEIVVAAGSQLALSGVIGGAGGIDKLGAGTLVLSGANTYRGTTAIKEGTLSVQNPLALAIDAGPAEIFGRATLELKGGIAVVGELLRV